MPGIGDPRFEHAVIAMCVHDAGGALGLGVGHVMAEIGLHGLLTQLEIEPGRVADLPIHYGGPVEPQRGFVLHSQDWRGEDSLIVGTRWALTSTLDVLRAIAEGNGPSKFTISLGYAGWSAGQLDEEMTRHGWFAAHASDELLFDLPTEKRWKRGFSEAGIDVRLLASTTGNA